MASNNQDKKSLNDILYDCALWSVKKSFKCICGNKAIGDISDGALCDECYDFIRKLDSLNLNQKTHLINYIYLDSINKLKCKCGIKYVTIDKQLCDDCKFDFDIQKQTIIKTFDRKRQQQENQKVKEQIKEQKLKKDEDEKIPTIKEFPPLTSPQIDIMNQKNNEIEELKKKIEELLTKTK